MRTRLRLITLVLALLPFAGSAVIAKPLFQKEYAAYYKGSTPKCATCHTVRPKLNAYGKALKAELRGAKAITPAMFKAAEAKRPRS